MKSFDLYSCKQKRMLDLSSRFDSFPHAEVNNDPRGYKTQHQLIADVSQLVETTRQAQDFASGKNDIDGSFKSLRF